MASEKTAESAEPEFDNHLRSRRQTSGLSQKQLANLAGITRQAVSAVEANQYSPATSVALQLARALQCRVEDLFSIRTDSEMIEGELLGHLPGGAMPVRAQVTQIGRRIWVRPLAGTGELTSLSAAADGLIIARDRRRNRVRVRLLKDRETLRSKVVIAGCDPAMFLASEHLRKYRQHDLVPCLMGSTLALDALKRGEVHVAGIHLAEERSGEWKLPNLKRSVGDLNFLVVTFAYWEEGFIVRQGNPKKIRAAADIAKPAVRIINRESGSGARRLLDKQLLASGIETARVKGYVDEVYSHLEVAARVKAGLADAGVGVRSAAVICGVDFVPLQRGRYDLVIPKIYADNSSVLKLLLDTIVGKAFRDELHALGGYDTRDTGKMVSMV